MADSSDFSFDAEDDTESDTGSTPSGGDNSVIRELRKQLKEATRAAKMVPELEAFKAEVIAERKEVAVTQAFEAVGLNPSHAKLYKALNPEIEVDAINPEAVASFAAEYDLITTTGETVEKPEAKATGYHPVTTGTAAPLQKLTAEDVDKMLRDGDIAGVQAAYDSGRVEPIDRPWATQG